MFVLLWGSGVSRGLIFLYGTADIFHGSDIITGYVVFMTSNQFSRGVKTMFSRGRNCVLVRLKQCFQWCNAIEKDRSLSRKGSFSKQRTSDCQTAKSIITHWPARRHQLHSELDASPYTGLILSAYPCHRKYQFNRRFWGRSSWRPTTDFCTWSPFCGFNSYCQL